MDNDQTYHTVSVGSIFIRKLDGIVIKLIDVRHILDIKKNLLFTKALETKGYKVVIDAGVLKLYHGMLVFLKGDYHHNLCYLHGRIVIVMTAVAKDSSDATAVWHMRLAHAEKASLMAFVKKGLIKGESTCKLDLCEYCVFDKKTCVSFGTIIHSTKDILEYVHTDIWGPTKTTLFYGR
ncbi:hypothetical protein KFK09_017108 [Dendrobium nobile]|uniref:GAG-pre-integrase domain-containing protein n=1 Tax=Dendrobium nobile TaxID=94219 RepID=A0A8T3B1C7_DENNO|nr:hypothetical protein KFK09_017108 [Dendrobium nobile]